MTTTSSRTAIGRAFSHRLEAGSAALVPYICAGWPDADTSLEMLRAAADAGADVLELGLPFSDPLADGPVIQKATFEALEGGMTVKGALEILRRFRKDHDTPVVIFTYLNPVVHHGMDAFVAEAADAGAQGLLLTDLPAGADPALEGAAERGGLDLIRLLAPTTAPERVPEVAKGGTGFLYYISRTGVTGARTSLREALAREVEALREHVSIPIAVGFGIAEPEQAKAVARASDGVVVGSALLKAMERGGVEEGRAFLASLRQAIDQVADEE
ncbi:MAG: tryptophan synthase subunit alpha [Gemmatimonadales bacterium]|nr:MAG: tryptophan synthase subunit alpha [Gemmatimonadales bacterium]